jgi:hypothetical protein
MNADQWIVINGDPINGYIFYGPFNCSEDANIFGFNYFDESGFHAVRLSNIDEENQEIDLDGGLSAINE